MRIQFVIGGARSGKSEFAENTARSIGNSVLYVATGVCTDAEMEKRIQLHQMRRPMEWGFVETPYDLGDSVHFYDHYHVVLVDCLSTWISNLLVQEPEENWQEPEIAGQLLEQAQQWLRAVEEIDGTLIVVSTEVGLGGVAMSRLGRWYQDVLGKCNQYVAAAADEVFFVAAGIPWRIK
ncbi:bifunctional adenosylcobinamide kinase/adenosylcobinamide-phosphate guanylyltransferase [Fodinisporobacter ferrooxydans]|uniref:Adenosylcobinamide kinase n=1 Tax=Fodinisporobacter ferrooxydans TaxID=2901836 RepID=A0ABY4CKW6_9BACL|nr:bifunctional adenosylcobinamide kinase/adenosylcobinamide-phosphate guanylyltransferase [Alicyclobacillaceae bacterium MYW30-H2]